MTRLTPSRPDRLDPDARAVYDKITSGPRGASVTGADGALIGPFNAMLLSPPVGDALQELGAAIRYGSRLTGRCRELATLVVANHCDSAFERQAHERLARDLGFTEEQLASLRAGAQPSLDDEEEATVHRIARALVTRGDLDEEEYSLLAPPVLFELTTLVGYYRTLALQMRVFRVQP
ncbi:carboxymuconolactone decarboxylase family protein [Nonomuraea endophytica]|uniref:4-carboxymuconolactone decarboxylase n=1 Tax=Nonomuraea endophytica TaxID=714136 RepID=A0A7W8A5N5_9ACTN|nr:carboxymuconolactone decarboxylase family protein [Nonomuraea endophytica]MBB5080041.1 4-carboxymuconolactone decarboxylase [Nonomuraea endophytica]